MAELSWLRAGFSRFVVRKRTARDAEEPRIRGNDITICRLDAKY
jgi:hypothetical protein